MTTPQPQAASPSQVREKPIIRGMWRRVAVLSALIAVCLLAAFAVLHSADVPAARATPVSVLSQREALSVAVASLELREQFERSRQFLGEVEASRRARLGFELPGMLATISVDEGTIVRRGDVLARINTDRLSARRRELSAALDLARAELDLARSTRSRVRDLTGAGHSSAQRLDEVDERYRAAQAALALAAARLDTLATELHKSSLRAPFDGQVIVRHLDEGAVIAAGTPVLTVQEVQQPQARVGVPDRIAGRIQAGAVLDVVAADCIYQARVKSVLPTLRAGTRIVDVLLDIDAEAGALRAGALVQLRVPDAVAARGSWVSQSALAAGRRGTWVLYGLVRDEGQPHAFADPIYSIAPLPVEVLAQDAGRAYVRGAFRDGDRIVSEGLKRVVPGQRVKPVPSRRDPDS